MPIYLSYYKLNDGRIYSVVDEDFIAEDQLPENANLVQAPDKNGQNTIEGLKETLSFYGYTIGNVLKTLEEVKSDKLKELNEKWLNAEAGGKINSSLGFEIDANERSLRDINGLVDVLTLVPDENIEFCDANNQFHSVTLDNLKIMKMEVLKHGQDLYQTKWKYREDINAAQDKESVLKIDIKF